TEDDLDEIAQNMREIQDEDGVFGRITDGHIIPNTKDKAVPESAQPELLGMFANPRTGTFGPQDVPCVLVDTFTYKRDKPIGRLYRSAEYYPKAKTIRGMALLLREPELDMGVVPYNMGKGTPDDFYVCYAANFDEAVRINAMEPEKATEPTYTPEEEMQFSKMCHFAANHPKGLRMYGFGPMPEKKAEGEEEVEGKKVVAEDKKKEPMELNSGSDEIRGKNQDAQKRAMWAKDPEPPEAHAKKSDPILYARLEKLEASNQELVQANAKLHAREQRSTCKAIVDSLKVDYKLDEEVEVGRLLEMTSAQREKHVAYIAANYRETDETVHVYGGENDGGALPVPTRQRPGDPPPQTDVNVGKMATFYASEHNLDYDAAVVEVKKGKRPTIMPQKKTERR